MHYIHGRTCCLGLALGLIVGHLAGCGSSEPTVELAEVTGKVTYQGEALKMGTVSFQPPSGPRARTVTEYSRQTPPGYKHSNTRFGNYPLSYFTPRIEWGRPLAAGQLNLLVFQPTRTTRESVELASRLDVRVNIVANSSHSGWWVGWNSSGTSFYDDIPSEQALNERAMVSLSPAYGYHAIIIGKIKWSVIPENIRKQILERVKGGTALVLVSPWGVDEDLQKAVKPGDATNPLAESVSATVPLAKLPLDMDLELLYPTKKDYPPRKIGPLEIRTGKLGEGKVVFLQYHDIFLKDGKKDVFSTDSWNRYSRDLGLTPFVGVEDDDLFYNYYMSILSKVIIYATGRESVVRVRPDTVDARVAREGLPAAPVTFNISHENRILPGTSLYYEIRDRLNKVIAKGEKEIEQKAGGTAFAPPFPVLKQDLYMTDVWIKRRGMVLDWASSAVTVTDTSYLKSVVADKEFFGRDERISGSITLKEPVPSGYKVFAELWDTYNRLEQRVELKAGGTKFRFNKIRHPLSRTYRIVCKVESGDFVLDERETWTGLPSNEFDEFQFVLWGEGWSGRIKNTHMRLLKEHGVTGYFDMARYITPDIMRQSADNLVKNNLKAWPLCWGLWSFPTYYGYLQGDWKETLKQTYLSRTTAYKRYGTLGYQIDSESTIQSDEKWDNPAMLKDYRIYLQGRYGNIAALNKIWGSAFSSFDDIRFISFIDARTGRQSSRWMEQDLYKRDRFNSVAEYTAGLVRELDPGARVGIDINCLGSHDSFDIPRMTKVIDAFIQSDLEYFDKDRDKSRVSAGYWVGFYKGEQSEWQMRTKPWESLFRGGNALAWWPYNNNINADLTEPYLCFKQMSEEVRDIHGGMDKLLMSADKRLDPILILWSNRSRIAGVYNPLETTWAGAIKNFMNLLRRVGLDYQCVGEDVVEEKLQFGHRQRVLILPASQSISRRGVEKIKAFAASGGLVIADYKPATMDEYLRPYGNRQKAGPEAEVEFKTCPKCKGKKIIHLGGAGDPLGNCPVCGGTGVVAKGGALLLNKSALDELFDFTKKGVKPLGKGHGLFLAGTPPVDEWRALRNSLIAHGGVKGDIEVLDTLGNTRTDLRTYVFDNGPAMFVGILPGKTVADPPGEEFILKTDRKMHVYNVRLHSYLGYTDAVTAGILPARAKLFALLPDRVEDGLALECPKTAYRPGEVVTLEIKTGPKTLQDVTLAVRIELLKGNRAIEAYTKKLAVKGGATHAIPLALNESRGEYILRLTEVISGQRQEIKLTVR